MFYGLDLDPDMLWIQNDWIRNPFQQMPGSGLRFSESRLKSLTMRNYGDEALILGIFT